MADITQGKQAYNITPSDTLLLTKYPACLECTVTGNIRVTLAGQVTEAADMAKSVVLKYIAGASKPQQICKVWATDTTATGIVGSY